MIKKLLLVSMLVLGLTACMEETKKEDVKTEPQQEEQKAVEPAHDTMSQSNSLIMRADNHMSGDAVLDTDSSKVEDVTDKAKEKMTDTDDSTTTDDTTDSTDDDSTDTSTGDDSSQSGTVTTQ